MRHFFGIDAILPPGFDTCARGKKLARMKAAIGIEAISQMQLTISASDQVLARFDKRLAAQSLQARTAVAGATSAGD